jgi:hypothetical protein
MQRMGAMESAAHAFGRLFPAVVLFCLSNSGCNSCYSGFWNGNGSGVAVSNASCTLTKTTGAVVVQLTAASASPGASSVFPPPLASPRGVQHIFVTLRGIDAKAGAPSGEDLSDWEELAPDLAAHPIQLDLLAVNGDSQSLGSPASANVPATIPADEYRQLRLRLVSLHASPDEPMPESNDCGNVGWNCIVFGDRSVQPLEFDGAIPEFHITQERGTDGIFRIFPNDVVHLSIQFDAAASVFFASNIAVRLAPVFSVVSQTMSSPDSARPPASRISR